MQWKIDRVREAPRGFGDTCVGLVSLTMIADAASSIPLVRWSKKDERSYPAGMLNLVSGSSVSLEDVPLHSGQRGPWLAVPGMEPPRSMLNEIAEAAFTHLCNNPAKPAPAARPDAPTAPARTDPTPDFNVGLPSSKKPVGAV